MAAVLRHAHIDTERLVCREAEEFLLVLPATYEIAHVVCAPVIVRGPNGAVNPRKGHEFCQGR